MGGGDKMVLYSYLRVLLILQDKCIFTKLFTKLLGIINHNLC